MILFIRDNQYRVVQSNQYAIDLQACLGLYLLYL
jgi:hypothetical protein